MTHNRCVCRFHSFVLLVFSLKDRRMAELKMDNNDGNTVRPDPLYFFLEPQIRCLKTHWKRTGWNAFSSNSCSVYARPSMFLSRTGTRLNFTLCRRFAHAHQQTEQKISPQRGEIASCQGCRIAGSDEATLLRLGK